MPWTAGYQTTVIGVDEARLVAIQSVIQGVITDLATVLQLAPISMPASSVTSSDVIIGDPDVFDYDSHKIMICVVGGGSQDGMDWESEWKYVGVPVTVSSLKNTLHTNIIAYVHPDNFPVSTSSQTNIQTQTEYRERLRSRVCDFIRSRVIQALIGIDLTLTSQETANTGDNLTMGTVKAIRKGTFEKSFGGGITAWGAHFHIEHTLN